MQQAKKKLQERGSDTRMGRMGRCSCVQDLRQRFGPGFALGVSFAVSMAGSICGL